MFLFLCVCDIVVIALMADINQCQAWDRCSAVPVDTISLNSWRRRPLKRGKNSPQDTVCTLKFSLLVGTVYASAKRLQTLQKVSVQVLSKVEMTVRTKKGLQTLHWTHFGSFTSNNKLCCFSGSEKRGMKPSGAAWTINSLKFLCTPFFPTPIYYQGCTKCDGNFLCHVWVHDTGLIDKIQMYLK